MTAAAAPGRPLAPAVLALDFDGVLCDGMREYFEAALRTHNRFWPAPAPGVLADLAASFARLRPVVETGWEMPLVIRALLAGASEAELLHDWRPGGFLGGPAPDELARTLDGVRDEWITEDRAGWLDSHRFYPGVIARLAARAGDPVRTVIVTTKEGRFVRELLRREGVELDENRIFGKEVRRPKAAILRELLAAHGGPLWFVEDRLKTLEDVAAEPDLFGTRLYLADWGYNTPGDRAAARRRPGIAVLSLRDFTGDFAAWPRPGA